MSNVDIYRQWGQFAIFPCKGNSNITATRNGFKDAKFGQDIESIVNLGYNIGLACEKSGVIVIDVDYHDENSTAMDDLKQLEIELGAQLPLTLTQATASGNGRHLIYSAKGIISPKGKIGKFCDIKYNGYIIISPSAINGSQYEIIDGIDKSGRFIIADLPHAWLDYINKTAKNSKTMAYNDTDTSENKIYTNINIERMFNNCAFLQFCRDNAENLPEPMWYSMITVLAQIKDSDELIHRLSEPYYGYSYDETQKKIDYARQFGHAQSCKYLSVNYQEVCKDCHSAVSERLV